MAGGVVVLDKIKAYGFQALALALLALSIYLGFQLYEARLGAEKARGALSAEQTSRARENTERMRDQVRAFAAACGGGEAQSVAAAIRDCRDRAATLGALHEAADRQAGEFAAAAEKHADEVRALKRVIVNDRARTE